MNIPASITFLQAQSTPLFAQKMGHNNKKNLGFIRKSSWFPWTTKVGFIVLALFARVTLEDKIEFEEANSSAGLLCISECATCPVICSPPPPPPLATSYSNHPPTSPNSPLLTQNPPPPPLLTSYPPPLPLTPSLNIPPPPPLLTSYPPPLPLITSHPPPPPLLKSYPPPPSLPPPVLPLPPPQPIITPPPSHSSSGAAPPPPPPPLKSNNNPPSSSGSAQPNVIAGPHNYPYPYYYYYASDASHFPIHAMPFFLPLLLFLHHIFF